MVGGWSFARGQTATTVGEQGPDEYHMTATLGMRNNSNVHFEEGSSQGDYISTLGLALWMRRHSPRTAWSLNYRPIFNHYLQFSELDSMSQAFDGNADYRLTERVRFQLRETFSLSRDPIIVATPQTGDSPVLTETDNDKRWRNNSGMNLIQDLSPRLSWGIGGVYYANRYENPELSDNNGVIGSLNLNSSIGTNSFLSGTYSPGFVTFYPSGEPAFNPNPCTNAIPPDQTITEVVGQTEGSTAHQLGLSWRHAQGGVRPSIPDASEPATTTVSLAGNWEVDVSAGASLVDQHERSFTRNTVCQAGQIVSATTEETGNIQENQKLFVGRAGLRRSFQHVDIDGAYQRRLTADTGADAVTVGDFVYANLGARVGRRFTYGLGVDYSTRKSLAGAATTVDITSEGVSLRGGVAVTDWFGLNAIADYRQQKNDGDPDTQNVVNYFLGMTFRIF